MDKKHFLTPADLRIVRNQVDPTTLWQVLGLQKDKHLSKATDWWAQSPLSDEKTASFHMDMTNGRWYCFSTQTGGGPIELVRSIRQCKGQVLNSYEAGRWLLEAGASSLPGRLFLPVSPPLSQTPNLPETKPASPVVENKPIRQNLVPLLEYHPLFAARGISASTCRYLGAGFLPATERNQNSPMRNRQVFQVRGISEKTGQFSSTCLTHLGRATTREQPEKWRFYGAFHKSLELYNIDHMYRDPQAQQQLHTSNTLFIVEGCFDVAKLIEAGVRNVVATFGAHVSEAQLLKITALTQQFPIQQCFLWFDRDAAGQAGMETALQAFQAQRIASQAFSWNQLLGVAEQQKMIPSNITDVCDFTIPQLQWLIRRFSHQKFPFFPLSHESNP